MSYEVKIDFLLGKYSKKSIKNCLSNGMHLICRTCVSSLVTLDLDNQSLELLQNLAFDMRASCMSTLFNQAIQGTPVFNVTDIFFTKWETQPKYQNTT